MPKKQGRTAPGRSFYVLSTSCGTLAVAAVVSAVYPVPEAASASRADEAPAVFWDEYWEDVDESAPIGGPLEIPTIGAVPDAYDERYAALDAARAAEDSEDFDDVEDYGADDWLPPMDYYIPGPSDWAELPDETITPEPAVPEPAPPAPPAPAPVAPEPPAPDVTPPPPVPPVETPATVTPPVTAEPSPSAPPPPVEEPPVEKPPVETPADVALVLGERYDHLDADGTVLYSLTLVSVDADLVCTAPDSLPAENGHLIGLEFAVAAPATGAPALSAADFDFLDGAGVLTDDIDTGSAAACTPEVGPPADEQPVTTTVVLDVPALTGTLVHRPESWPAGLRWQF